jgi:hypothetical protein
MKEILASPIYPCSLGAKAMDPTTARVLLRLQERRCEITTLWRKEFDLLLQGTRTPEAFATVTHSGILPKLSAVSAELISLRDDPTAAAPIRVWVTRVQAREKKLFELTIASQQAFIAHLSSTAEPHDCNCAVIQRCNRSHYQPQVKPAPPTSSTAPAASATIEVSSDDDDDEAVPTASGNQPEGINSTSTTSASDQAHPSGWVPCEKIGSQLSVWRKEMVSLEEAITEEVDELQAIVSDG